MFDKLSAPFPPEAIHWRAQIATERNGGSALALAYLDARDVMDRLDQVCGPENWQDYYDETAKGRVICRLSIRVGEEWIAKSDGSGDSDIEGDKGAISGAFKRAAVKLGIGRYLYDVGDVWAPCDLVMREGKLVLNKNGKPMWKAWKPAARDEFAKALSKASKPTGPLTDATRDWLAAQLQSIGKQPADLFRHLSPTTFKDLTYEQIPDIQSFINANKKAA